MRASLGAWGGDPLAGAPSSAQTGPPPSDLLRRVACFLCHLPILSHISCIFCNHEICKPAAKAWETKAFDGFHQIRRRLDQRVGGRAPLAPGRPPAYGAKQPAWLKARQLSADCGPLLLLFQKHFLMNMK